MPATILIESALQDSDAISRTKVLAGEPFVQEIAQGQTVRIVDLEGIRPSTRSFTTPPTTPIATARRTPSAPMAIYSSRPARS